MSASSRRSRSTRCALHSSKLTIRGAIPSGCSVARSAFAGGSSNAARCLRAAARSPRSRARGSSAGRGRAPGSGSWACRKRSSASRTGAISSLASGRSPYAGAYPAASRRRFRSRAARRDARRGAAPSRDSAAERPVSMKLRWRVETADPDASSSWLRWRRARHSRSSCPALGGRATAAMARSYRFAARGSITSQVIALRCGRRHRGGTHDRRGNDVRHRNQEPADRRALGAGSSSTRFDSTARLRRAGVLLAAGAPVLDGVLGVRAAVLVPLGLFLVGYAVALFALARAGAPARG